MILTAGKERIRFVKFATVGALGALIDFAVMNLFTHLRISSYMPDPFRSFALVSNFTLNRYWTYPDSRPCAFCISLACSFWSMRRALLSASPHFITLSRSWRRHSKRWSIFRTTRQTPGKKCDPGFAIGVVMIWNFFINRYWTYNDVE